MEPGFYRHYKGGVYYVLGIFTNTETNEQMVAYTNFKDNWVRPLNVFLEFLENVPRFKKL